MVLEYTLEEIDRVAEQLIDLFTHSIVAMSGQMGSGKTTLVQAIVSQLGSEETVSSPTFGLVHEYNIPNGKLVHMDCIVWNRRVSLNSSVLMIIFPPVICV